jgi:hypothetical protein
MKASRERWYFVLMVVVRGQSRVVKDRRLLMKVHKFTKIRLKLESRGGGEGGGRDSVK